MQYQPSEPSAADKSTVMLPVIEIFHSIQGEGRWLGQPAVFIRFKFCNLSCSWCDTKFTWEPELIEEGALLGLEEIETRLMELVPEKSVRSMTHVVLTGGEPMLHRQLLPELIQRIKQSGFGMVEIETNGTIAPTDLLIEAVDWWNCSPKLSNNGLAISRNRNVETLQIIADTGRADFKFVVCSSQDIVEIERDYVPFLPSDRIMLMPEGITRESQLGATPWVLANCQARGWRFSPRLHILLWGNERKR